MRSDSGERPIHSDFTIEIVRGDDALRVEIHGELDVATAPALSQRLIEAQTSGAPLVVIDLEGVSFIDSTGLRVLLEAHARSLEAGGGRLEMTAGREQAQRLFQIAGVLDKLPFVAAPGE